MNEQASRFAKFTSLIHPQRRDAVESLIQMRAEFVENLRLMQEQLATRKKEIESFDFLIDSITKSIEATEETGAMPPGKAIESPKAALPDTEETNGASELLSGAATVRDIAHCSTQREAARVIAEVNGGDIDLKSAAKVIKAAGLSKGMVGTVVSSLHNFMSNSGDWVYSGPSKFRLVAGQETESKDNDKPSSVLENSGETRDAVGGPLMVSEISETAA